MIADQNLDRLTAVPEGAAQLQLALQPEIFAVDRRGAAINVQKVPLFFSLSGLPQISS
jgi:hypothetical protein